MKLIKKFNDWANNQPKWIQYILGIPVFVGFGYLLMSFYVFPFIMAGVCLVGFFVYAYFFGPYNEKNQRTMNRDPQTFKLFNELVEDIQASNMGKLSDQFLQDATKVYNSSESEPVVFRRLDRLRYLFHTELLNRQFHR